MMKNKEKRKLIFALRSTTSWLSWTLKTRKFAPIVLHRLDIELFNNEHWSSWLCFRKGKEQFVNRLECDWIEEVIADWSWHERERERDSFMEYLVTRRCDRTSTGITMVYPLETRKIDTMMLNKKKVAEIFPEQSHNVRKSWSLFQMKFCWQWFEWQWITRGED